MSVPNHEPLRRQPAPRRRPLSKRVRFAILERDGFRCRYCGSESSEAKLHVDHRFPHVAGGSDHPDNLVTACQDCNLGKSSFLPIRYIAMQREQAMAVQVFQRSALRFGKDMDMWEDFSMILDLCLSELEPEYMLLIVNDAASWEAAKDGMFRYAGVDTADYVEETL